MKSSKLILALWLGATSWALTLPQKSVTPAVAPVAAKPRAQGAAVNAGKTTVTPKSVAPAETTFQTKPRASFIVRSSHRRRRKRSRAAQPVQSAAMDAKPKHLKGERDPFVSPIVERTHEAAVCNGTGRQCLRVGEISLRGVVQSPSGFIAVVVNGDHTYFLHDNDPLADGAVERITNNEIILREHSSDALGRPLTREVIRKLGAPAV